MFYNQSVNNHPFIFCSIKAKFLVIFQHFELVINIGKCFHLTRAKQATNISVICVRTFSPASFCVYFTI